MLRKMLLIAAAVAMPVGVVAATAGTAAASTIDNTGAPATAHCTSSGGTLTFKVPIGIATPGGYVVPAKNKGNQIKIAGVVLTCTSLAVSGTFTGTVSGKIKTANPGESAATFYGCTTLLGVTPGPGGTQSGSLKIAWSPPAGQKFGGGKKSLTSVSSTLGGVNGSGQATFTIPGHPGTGSVTGSFPGADAGASATSTDATVDNEAQLGAQCTTAAGLGTIALGTGTSTLQ